MHVADDGEVFSKDEETAQESEVNEELPTKIDFENEEEDDEELEYNMVVRRALSTQPLSEDKEASEQRSTIFHMMCKVQGKTCLVIIDSGSCANVVSEDLVKKLYRLLAWALQRSRGFWEGSSWG